MEGIQRINNTLFIEELYNKSLPEWTKKIYPSADMTAVAAFTFSISTYTRQLARLKSGPLIKEMLQRFVDKSKGKLNPDRSVWIYSAHDTTVANVLNTLKLFDVSGKNNCFIKKVVKHFCNFTGPQSTLYSLHFIGNAFE